MEKDLVKLNDCVVLPYQLKCRILYSISSGVVVADTTQSTTLSWLLWMFVFEPYANQSLDRHKKLIGMRCGTTSFIYGMDGSKVLLQIPVQIHGFTSHGKFFRIWHDMLPLCLRIGGFNLCSPGILWVARPRHMSDSKRQAYCRHAGVGSSRKASGVG